MDSELQRLQAERDALLARVHELTAAHEEFLRAVSHDLRAPLRHVTSYATLLQEVLQELPDAAPQVREALGFAATMRGSAQRMAEMLEGLQAISRAGRAPLHLVSVPVSAALEQAYHDLPLAKVQWQVEGPPLQVQADAALFGQLLGEVLANAVKFSQSRHPPCVVATVATGAPGRVMVRIADNGVGFDPAHAQGLFGVFQRLHREGECEGVGAGLALCRLIADRHGAGILLSAQPDAGCTVLLDWPGA